MDNKDIQKELKKALLLMNSHWCKQNDEYDKKSRFIYKAKTVDECIRLAKENNIDLNYVLHRWYNFITSKTCENMLCEYGAKAEKDLYNKTIDLYINNIPYDVKLTVFPKKLLSKQNEYNLRKRDGKDKMINWLYDNQSSQGRKHLKNRLFIVVDDKTYSNCMAKKSDFNLIEGKIRAFIDYSNTVKVNELKLHTGETVKSDIIYVA